MLVDVQTFFFHTGRNAETVQLLDAIEEDDTTGSSPEVNHENAKALSTEEAPTVAIEGTV